MGNTATVQVYEVVIYRDTDTDAAVERRIVPGVYPSPTQAINEARRQFTGQWRTATVHEGTLVRKRVNGRDELEFEDGEAVRWYVGRDYIQREVTA
jgi:hypothetical protein